MGNIERCPECGDRALADFQEALTRALNEAGVPAMPSWQAAIDYLASQPRGAVDLIRDLYSFAYSWSSAGKAHGDKVKWQETLERARTATGGQ